MLLSAFSQVLFQHAKLFFFFEELSALLFIDFKDLHIRVDCIHTGPEILYLFVDYIFLLGQESNLFVFERVINLCVL